jgi:UDP-N-acetylglucosamine--N-acetylmuramyl-(pentapeptide) pyrophosphoryl-undecaprenol N-acetylglucosamine transferase
MKILFSGGGTGGHVLPIIGIVREMRRIYPEKNIHFFYLGPKDEISQIFLSKEGVKIKTISAGKLRRYFELRAFFQNIIDLFKFLLGFFQAFFYIFFLKPDLIFSKGGYGSLPTVLAGWILRVPIFLHESDIVPGLANRFLSKFALEIFVSFPETKGLPANKIIPAGNPIRRELLAGSKEKAKEIFNLTGEKPIILILGGSQGAQRINNLILQILPEILREFELIHQLGTQNFKEFKNSAELKLSNFPELKKYYHPFPFLDEEELRNAYCVCNLILSRAGSGSIFEISAIGKPSILIPLPEAAQNHQVKNAYAYAQSGAAIVMEEANLTPHFFLEKLKDLFSHPEELRKMANRAKEFARPEAGKLIADYILKEVKMC